MGNVCAGCFEIIPSNGLRCVGPGTNVWHRRCYATACRVRGFLEGMRIVGMDGVPAEGSEDQPQ